MSLLMLVPQMNTGRWIASPRYSLLRCLTIYFSGAVIKFRVTVNNALKIHCIRVSTCIRSISCFAYFFYFFTSWRPRNELKHISLNQKMRPSGELVSRGAPCDSSAELQINPLVFIPWSTLLSLTSNLDTFSWKSQWTHNLSHSGRVKKTFIRLSWAFHFTITGSDASLCCLYAIFGP